MKRRNGNEVVTFFNSRGRHAKAVEVGRRLLQSPSVHLVHVDTGLFEEAWRYFQKRPGHPRGPLLRRALRSGRFQTTAS